MALIEASIEEREAPAGHGLWLRVFVQNRLATLGLVIIIAMTVFCFLGPLVYHTNQTQTNPLDATLGPGAGHPLGTDGVGYDVLGRLMLGGQSSLEVGLAAAFLASVWGTAVGAVAGYFGGMVDGLLMRVVDALLAIPSLLLILLLASVFTPSTLMLIVVIAFVSWPSTARLVRGDALSLRSRDYVLAAKVVGADGGRIIFRHIVPNSIGTIVVQTTFEIANAILLLAALSFLGLGVPPPAANWGGMLTDGLNYIQVGYWWLIYPAGAAIVLTVIAFNFVGDALRDALEVRLQRR
jgi:peptide/nickel transport system permease protein